MNYLDDKLVFIGGATGLAGANIISRILSSHQQCRIRACLHSRKQPLVESDRIQYVTGDLRNQNDCRRMIKGCNCAIMAAAETGGAAVLKNEPWRQVNDNLIMNAQFLEACAFEKVRRIACVVSATVYQEFEGSIKEDQLDLNLDPHPAYWGVGWVNRTIEKLCSFWHRECGLDIVIARTSNIFGPFARFDPERSNFIPAIIRKAVDGMDPFEIWGNPDVTRDVIYVEDFASAIVAMMNHDEIKFDVFNVGSGEKTTVGNVVKWALKYARHAPSRINYVENKPTTIKLRALDCSKAKRVLRWAPRHSIEGGIRHTVDWWKKNRNIWNK